MTSPSLFGSHHDKKSIHSPDLKHIFLIYSIAQSKVFYEQFEIISIAETAAQDRLGS